MALHEVWADEQNRVFEPGRTGRAKSWSLEKSEMCDRVNKVAINLQAEVRLWG